MTTSFWVLIGILAGFWVPLSVLLRRKSLFPVVPVVPSVAAAAGMLLELWVEWLGAIVIGVLHAAPLAIVLIGNWREYFTRTRDDHDASP